MAAVKVAQTEDKSVFDTAKELGVSSSSLRRWINEYDEYGESAFPGRGNFSILHMKSKSYRGKMQNCKWRMIYKKTPGLLEEKECVRYQFLKENQKKYNIKKACKILKISRYGFYDYLHRRKSRRSIENEALAEIITDIFKENEGRYGSRRIQKVLLQRNIKIRTVATYMVMTI